MRPVHPALLVYHPVQPGHRQLVEQQTDQRAHQLAQVPHPEQLGYHPEQLGHPEQSVQVGAS